MWYSRAKVVVDGEFPFSQGEIGQRFAGFVDRNNTVPYKAVMRSGHCSQVFHIAASLFLCTDGIYTTVRE
jgi:hypothetical protein